MRALVIEDDAIIAMLIEDVLRDVGFTSVETASTEAEATQAALRNWPDFVTSDGALSFGTGLAAARTIQASGLVPLVFITGDPEHARRCFPASLVIEKPFSAAELVSAVEQMFPRGLRRVEANIQPMPA